MIAPDAQTSEEIELPVCYTGIISQRGRFFIYY